jgi:hypothetical protein
LVQLSSLPSTSTSTSLHCFRPPTPSHDTKRSFPQEDQERAYDEKLYKGVSTHGFIFLQILVCDEALILSMNIRLAARYSARLSLHLCHASSLPTLSNLAQQSPPKSLATPPSLHPFPTFNSFSHPKKHDSKR